MALPSMNGNGNSPGRPVVAGVLNKYRNMAKGWKDRLFVLSDDKLMYYKLTGNAAVNVQNVLDYFDPSGANTKLIGAQIFLLQKRQGGNEFDADTTEQAAPGCSSICRAPHAKAPIPAGVYDVKKSKLRESSTESHKFYVHMPGQPPCMLKTETPDDRVAWVIAMSSSKVKSSILGSDYPPVRTPLIESSAPLDTKLFSPQGGSFPAVQHSNERMKNALAEAQELDGLSDAGVARVQRAYDETTRVLEETMRLVHQRDEQLRLLMDERRQLQTELVADTQRYGNEDGDRHSGRDSTSTHADDDDDASVASVAFSHDGDLFFDAFESIELQSDRRAKAVTAAKERSVLSSVETSSASAGAREAPVAGGESQAEPEWLASETVPQRRTALPPPAEVQKSVSLWGIIKECIGKDLTRICLPVFFNEPLSALQKVAEEFEYAKLIERAASYPKGSPERMLMISVFALTGYSASGGRTCKPFNPLLGETFELVDKERGYRFVSEKVVHHPTILAARVEGCGWHVDLDFEAKSKFWGRCIELKPVGHVDVRFHDGEIMTWNKVTTTINNLILGKIYIEHCGTMRVQSNSSEKEMRIKFKDGGGMLFGGSKHQISGRMFEKGTELPSFRVEGTWDTEVTVDRGKGAEVLWKAAPPPKDPTRYNLSQFAIQLNEMTEGLEPKLPPTDCRLRPDQSALEAGYFDKANEEKQRLEMKQRRARKEAEEGKPIQSRWFQPVPGAKRGHELGYVYTGGYWEQRAEGNFTGCRDIFGLDTPEAPVT